jgi:prophage antirepressor-like protein
MPNLCLLDFNDSQIRTVIGGDRTVWFVAQDVCEVLELDDTSKACQNLDDDEKLIRTLFVSGQNRDVLTLSEGGLYQLVFRSNKPEAKAFRKWICNIVIPSIRATGTYKSPKAMQLENWKAARLRATDISAFFTNACKNARFKDTHYRAAYIHNRITTVICGMTANELKDHCEKIDGDITIGLNHIESIKQLNMVTEVKRAFASATTIESEDDRLERIFRKFNLID